MTVATRVEVVELEARDGFRIHKKGGSDFYLFAGEEDGSHLKYMWWRMMTETGRHFIAEWEGEAGQAPPFHLLPKGLEIGGEKVGLCHGSFVYNEAGRAIGFYKDFSQGPRRLFFVYMP